MGIVLCFGRTVHAEIIQFVTAVKNIDLAHGTAGRGRKVLNGVLHSAALIEIADKQIISGAVPDVPRFGFWQLHRGKAASVAGGGGQRTQRARRKGAAVIPSHVRDGVGGAVVALHGAAHFQH